MRGGARLACCSTLATPGRSYAPYASPFAEQSAPNAVLPLKDGGPLRAGGSVESSAAAGCALPRQPYLPAQAHQALRRACPSPGIGTAGGVRRCERCRVPCDMRQLPSIVCRSPVLPPQSAWARAPTSLAQRASLLAAEPVVTTRPSPAPTWSYVGLAQVTSPSDGLLAPSSSLSSRAMRLVLCPHLAGVKKRLHGAPTCLGSRVHIDGATSYWKHHRRQERVQPRPAAKTLHTAGVVSPTSLVNLATPRRGETDRNTERSDSTPAAKKEPTLSRSRCRT